MKKLNLNKVTVSKLSRNQMSSLRGMTGGCADSLFLSNACKTHEIACEEDEG